MSIKQHRPTLNQYLVAWAVHLFTTIGACLGVLTLIKIYQHDYIYALWLMGVTILIDAVDGTFARLAHVKTVLPHIDGALLDNIIDYLNYVITPCVFLLVKPGMLPYFYDIWVVFAITLASSYQFCQSEAKTPDHFFKGFPCYWNFAVFYMFLFQTSMVTNALLLSILCVLIFIPIKYVYPSRLDYLTKSTHLKILMHICSLLCGASCILILWNYPKNEPIWLSIPLGYVVMYLILSIYRTFSPIVMPKLPARREENEKI
jgi:phosphatidylcholine synthase